MPYLIDGHNLIGQLPDISLTEPDDEAKLVQKLLAFAARTSKHIIVVFDHGLPGGRSRMSTGSVEVVFAPQHLNADRILLERINTCEDPRNWTIVSSDRVVLATAERRGMRPVRSTDFAPQLQPPQRKKKDPRDKLKHDAYVSKAEVEEWLRLFGES